MARNADLVHAAQQLKKKAADLEAEFKSYIDLTYNDRMKIQRIQNRAVNKIADRLTKVNKKLSLI